ncbi:MAG: 4-(cytidine 5'-diphospho)-2-C-methyl-D-erythritol kinase [Candidatus Gracilibacteria bacterium]|jgi:4-diphosphocytidyl-2-C-methyl-D-erythritol kinase
MKVKAYAKINLCLDVLKKDPSGYHKIQTVFHEIKSIYDEIEITPAKNEDVIFPFLPPKIKAVIPPQKSDDMIFKALMLIKKTFKVKKFVKIKVKKNIPFASGLGGGSSDAATVLKGLNKLWKLKLSKAHLAKLGAKLGMDVPFFIYGGTASGLHYGEKITPLPEIKNIKFKIHSPKITPATRKTEKNYAKLDLKKCGKNSEKTKRLIAAIKVKDKKSILENLHNDFEIIIKTSKNHHLSGSGPATFTAK